MQGCRLIYLILLLENIPNVPKSFYGCMLIAVLKGYMTIKNVTRQVAFYVELVDANVENRYSERITVKTTTTIRRSEFGMHTLLPAVSDNVNLFMSIDALKKGTAISMID